MTTVYPTTPAERRLAKARQIVAGAASWTTLRADAGATVYRIPSQAEPGVSYETDGRGCSCPDYLGRVERGGPAGPCKHALAVQLLAARSADPGPDAYAAVYGHGPEGARDDHDPATCRRVICADC